MNLQIILCLLLINVNTTEAGDNLDAVKPDSFEELLEALVSFTNYALSFTDKIYYITDKQFKKIFTGKEILQLFDFLRNFECNTEDSRELKNNLNKTISRIMSLVSSDSEKQETDIKTVDDVKDSENSTKNIKSTELLPGSVVSIRDLHNLSQEVLNGIFENIPKDLYIEDSFVDYLLNNYKQVNINQYNNISKFLHLLEEKKEIYYNEQFRKLLNNNYVEAKLDAAFFIKIIPYLLKLFIEEKSKYKESFKELWNSLF